MLDYSEIPRLLRYYILLSSSTAESGHPTSSLSAADLMSVLWYGGYYKYDFSKPENMLNDRLIFSKGHASSLLYALYKVAGVISTDELKQYRTSDSMLEGHPTPRIPWVDVSTGSLGMGLSYGLGMAIALKRLSPSNTPTVYTLIGDGELTEGQNWEAMQIAAANNCANLVGILDVNSFGQSAPTLHQHDLNSIQEKISSFGWETKIIDGHNYEEINDAYIAASSTRTKPFIIIAKTIKGYGVEKFLDGNNWHSKVLTHADFLEVTRDTDPQSIEKIFQVNTPGSYQNNKSPQLLSLATTPQYTNRIATKTAFGQTLASIAQNQNTLIVLDADVGNSTGTNEVAAVASNKYLNCYIAEQNMVSMAVGFSKIGHHPVASTFAAFLTRAYDQIRMANLSFAKVLINGAYAGVSIGRDGFSQMGIEDIAMMRALPCTTILYPSDAVQTQALTQILLNNPGISYIRTTREPTPIIYDPTHIFTIGGSATLRSSEHDKYAIISAGITVHEALLAYEALSREGLYVRIIDLYSIKPIDRPTLFQAAHECPYGVITVEDHSIHGGVGDAVLDAFANTNEPLPKVSKLGVSLFPHSATSAQNLAYQGISAKEIVAKIRQLCQNKHN